MTLTKQEKINILKDRITDFEMERERMQELVEMNFKQVEEQRKDVTKFEFLIDSHIEQIKEIKKDASTS